VHLASPNSCGRTTARPIARDSFDNDDCHPNGCASIRLRSQNGAAPHFRRRLSSGGATQPSVGGTFEVRCPQAVNQETHRRADVIEARGAAFARAQRAPRLWLDYQPKPAAYNREYNRTTAGWVRDAWSRSPLSPATGPSDVVRLRHKPSTRRRSSSATSRVPATPPPARPPVAQLLAQRHRTKPWPPPSRPPLQGRHHA
jgi:hypothetical protein